jgi:hypothetical protein
MVNCQPEFGFGEMGERPRGLGVLGPFGGTLGRKFQLPESRATSCCMSVDPAYLAEPGTFQSAESSSSGIPAVNLSVREMSRCICIPALRALTCIHGRLVALLPLLKLWAITPYMLLLFCASRRCSPIRLLRAHPCRLACKTLKPERDLGSRIWQGLGAEGVEQLGLGLLEDYYCLILLIV